MPGRFITVVGDALLDRDLDGAVERVAPDAPAPVVDHVVTHVRAGGAALAASLARSSDTTVRLVTALGRDPAREELHDLLAADGVEIVDIGRADATPEKIRVRADGHTLVRIDHGGTATVGPLTAAARSAINDADAVLVADYGAGVAEVAREALQRDARVLVWDPHPRGSTPVAATTVVTPSFAEACRFAGHAPAPRRELGVAADIAAQLRAVWHVAAVAVTLGDAGAVYVDGTALPLVAPAPRVASGDPCGAGDAFAAHLTVALMQGALPSEAVAIAVDAATDYVAARGATHTDDQPQESSRRLVATSGCFDLLHAGHVHMLDAARRLGDRLVVLLNSDASVRRLKGHLRPIVPQHDRACLLRALTSVDDVIIFDDDTPARALQHLRPDVFVKGGDYGARDIPEAGVLAAWGGRTVIVPYLNGRSTTALAKEAMDARRGH